MESGEGSAKNRHGSIMLRERRSARGYNARDSFREGATLFISDR